MLNPVHLRTFSVVCRTGSFAVAARELGYTPSAVSQQIVGLERATGLTLFERVPNGVRPTSIASALVERSDTVLAGLERLETDIRALADGRIGRLTLGSFPSASVRLVPIALSRMVSTYPTAQVGLEEGEPDQLLGLLDSGDLDLVVYYDYGGSPRSLPEGVRRVQLLREDLVFLSPRAMRLPWRGRLSVARAQQWVAPREGTAMERQLRQLCAAEGFAPSVSLYSNDYDVIRQLVSRGLGVAIVPGLGYEPDLRVRAERVVGDDACRRVYAAYRTANANPLVPVLEGVLREVSAGGEFGEFVSTESAPVHGSEVD